MKSRVILPKEIKQRVNEEVRKQVQNERNHYTLCAIKLCLYVMYCEYGFGEKRLSRLWEMMFRYMEELNARYEDCWVAKIESDLKRVGIEFVEE